MGTATLSVVLAVGCGGSGDGSDSDGDGGTSTGADDGDDIGGVEPEERSPDTAPPAQDGADVEPYIGQLLADHDAAVNEITADPELARDPDSSAIRRYLDVYEPDSARARELVDAWVQMADAGERVEPLDAGMPSSVTSLDSRIEVVSADEVRFQYCSRRHLQVVDADGAPVDAPSDDQLPGEAIATRVDGRWRLRQLELIEGGGTCHTVVVTEPA
jgi:hypothetical protein